MRYITFTVMMVISAVVSASASAQSDADAVASFRKQVADYVASYKTDRREQVEQTSGGWSRKYFEMDADYKIDVQRRILWSHPISASLFFL